MWLRGKTAQPYLDCRAAAVEYQQYHKADKLADGRCPGSPGHAHFQPENQHRVKHNVEHCAGHDADHRNGGAALKPHLVVEHERSDQKRRTQKDDPQVGDRVGQNCWRRAQQPGDRRNERHAQRCDAAACQQRTEKSCGSHTLGSFIVACAQLAGNVIARPMPKEKADGLQQRHSRVGHAYRRRGLGVQLPNKQGIGHIVKACHQHTDNRGRRHFQNQAAHRCLCHIAHALFRRHSCCFHRCTSLPQHYYCTAAGQAMQRKSLLFTHKTGGFAAASGFMVFVYFCMM